MPTQTTNLTSETECDADLSTALAIGALDDASGAARPIVSIAAPGSALSEKNAAGLMAASAQSVLSLLKRCWRAFQERAERQRLRASLHELSERELMDIGVAPGEIEYIVAHRTVDRLRDGTADPWIMSRGVM